MKNMKRILGLGVVLIGFSTAASAQATTSASATGTIIEPISIVKNVDLNFGNMSSNGSVGQVLLPATAGTPTRVASGGLTAVLATPGTVTAAQFTVTGNNGYTYLITLPTTPVALTGTGLTAGVTADNFVSSYAGTSNIGTITTGTTDIFYVGATFKTPAGAIVPGVYTNSAFNVTVNYN